MRKLNYLQGYARGATGTRYSHTRAFREIGAHSTHCKKRQQGELKTCIEIAIILKRIQSISFLRNFKG